METLKTGSAAYYDTLSNGLIPCKVTRVTGTSGLPSTAQAVEFTITKTKGPYKEGEELATSGLNVAPVGSISRGKYQATIKLYNVKVDNG